MVVGNAQGRLDSGRNRKAGADCLFLLNEAVASASVSVSAEKPESTESPTKHLSLRIKIFKTSPSNPRPLKLTLTLTLLKATPLALCIPSYTPGRKRCRGRT